jgi:hypothetical protein
LSFQKVKLIFKIKIIFISPGTGKIATRTPTSPISVSDFAFVSPVAMLDPVFFWELKRCSFKAKENGLCMRHQLNKKEYENDGICQANLHYSKPPAEHKKRGRPPKTPVDAPQDSFEKENLRQRRNAHRKELRKRNSELRTRLWKKNGLPAPPLESPPTESESVVRKKLKKQATTRTARAERMEKLKFLRSTESEKYDALRAEIIKRQDEFDALSAEISKRHDELYKMRTNFITSFKFLENWFSKGWSGIDKPENVPWSDAVSRFRQFIQRTRHL